MSTLNWSQTFPLIAADASSRSFAWCVEIEEGREERKVLKSLLSIASTTWNGPIQFHFLLAFFRPLSTADGLRFSCVVSCKIRKMRKLSTWPSCLKCDYFWMIYHLVFILQCHSISPLFYFARFFEPGDSQCDYLGFRIVNTVKKIVLSILKLNQTFPLWKTFWLLIYLGQLFCSSLDMNVRKKYCVCLDVPKRLRE